MVEAGSAREGFTRWIIGNPRIWVGVACCCLGLVWLLLAAFEGPTVTRILLGTVWLALGIFYGVVAVRDRKHGRGAYRMKAPARTADDESE